MTSFLVIGAGGAGMNILSDRRLADCGRCVAVNTDAARLASFTKTEKLQIGPETCAGLPAKTPARGERAAEESREQLGALMTREVQAVFVLAGLGGGTGTGVVTVVAELAKERDLPFTAVVSLPPSISGSQRELALEALKSLGEKDVDVFVLDMEQIFSVSDISLPQLLEQANAALVEFVLSRVPA